MINHKDLSDTESLSNPKFGSEHIYLAKKTFALERNHHSMRKKMLNKSFYSRSSF
jgi:hypothetical protein